jgi:hypothetical protein
MSSPRWPGAYQSLRRWAVTSSIRARCCAARGCSASWSCCGHRAALRSVNDNSLAYRTPARGGADLSATPRGGSSYEGPPTTGCASLQDKARRTSVSPSRYHTFVRRGSHHLLHRSRHDICHREPTCLDREPDRFTVESPPGELTETAAIRGMATFGHLPADCRLRAPAPLEEVGQAEFASGLRTGARNGHRPACAC